MFSLNFYLCNNGCSIQKQIWNGLAVILICHFFSFFSYLINLVQLMVHKVEGQLICEDVCVDRLTEIRTVLEKIKPLDQRLSYQVDKLIKTSNTGLSGKCLQLIKLLRLQYI